MLSAALAIAACSREPTEASTAVPAVLAKGETEPVGTIKDDAADDPAIWRNPANPAASLIVGTDKKAGIHVYGLDGKPRAFVPAGRVNNVDLIEHGSGILVVASDRNDDRNAKLQLYRLDGATGQLQPLGFVGGGGGEAYGVCLWQDAGTLFAFSVLKSGQVPQIRIDFDGSGRPTGTTVRTLRLKSQGEGCVVDPRSRQLYVGEEDVGIWRFAAGASDSVTGTLVAKADGRQLHADVEGLALAPAGDRGGYLVASSQGDFSFAVYALPDMLPAGRFRIAKGRFGSVEETDGIALALGSFGPEYPIGLLIAQDGMNEPLAQNFKLASWGDVVDLLKLQGFTQRAP